MAKQGQRNNLPDGHDILNMLAGTQKTDEVHIQLDRIRLDGGTQPRSQIDRALVDEYAADMEDDAQFPAVVVYYDGENYWLADGFHRWHAAHKLGLDAILVNVLQGTRRDAQLYSVGANATHGRKRTNADKRRAVMLLLADPEWAGWADNKIAKVCKVSNRFVGNIRNELSLNRSKIPDSDLAHKAGGLPVKVVEQARENVQGIGDSLTVQRGDQVYQQQRSGNQRATSRPPSPAPKPSQKQASPPPRAEPLSRVFVMRVRDQSDVDQLAHRIEELIAQDRDGYGFEIEVKQA